MSIRIAEQTKTIKEDEVGTPSDLSPDSSPFFLQIKMLLLRAQQWKVNEETRCNNRNLK